MPCSCVSKSVLERGPGRGTCVCPAEKLRSKFPERPGAHPAKFPEQKCAGFFSKNRGEKSGENGEKFRFDTYPHNNPMLSYYIPSVYLFRYPYLYPMLISRCIRDYPYISEKDIPK
jgi:hypothetical protein